MISGGSGIFGDIPINLLNEDGHEWYDWQAPKEKAMKKGKVILCHSCRTDLREANKTLHEKMGHRVEVFDEDPRKK